jgi:dGTPase
VLFESLRRMLSEQVYDLIDATQAALNHARPQSADEARRCPALVRFSESMARDCAALKGFLRQALYRHPQVVETTEQAKGAIRELFDAYRHDPAALPPGVLDVPPARRARAQADYIAGMTDRFALREHERLTGRRLFP